MLDLASDDAPIARTDPAPAPSAGDGAGQTTWDDRGFLRWYKQLFRQSEKMREIERMVLRIADSPTVVSLSGESGTGKERVAQAIHALSVRANGPWVAVRCAALRPDLLESDLFGCEEDDNGHETRTIGRIDMARAGTLFLDQIDEVPRPVQAKLVRLLEDGQFVRAGGRTSIASDVRVVVASSKDLDALVGRGAFRDDLYYRIQAVTITVPPLRERPEEIPSLVRYFLAEHERGSERTYCDLSPETLGLMAAYRWPGNVRELENFVTRYALLGDERALQAELEARIDLTRRVEPTVPVEDAGLRAVGRRAAHDAELALIHRTLDAVGGNRAEAARRLKVSYKTLLAKLNHDEARSPSS